MNTKLFIFIYISFFCNSCLPSFGGWCYSPSIQAAKKNKTYLRAYNLVEYQQKTPLPKPDSVFLEYQFFCSDKFDSLQIKYNVSQLICFKDGRTYDYNPNKWRVRGMKSYSVEYKHNCYRFWFDSIPNNKIVIEFISNDSTHTPMGKMVFERIEE